MIPCFSDAQRLVAPARLVHARRVERLVRIEGVDPEEEGLAGVLEVVEQAQARAHHARGGVVVLAVAVDRVPAGHGAQAADLDGVGQLGQQVALDRAAGGGPLEGLVEEPVRALREARLDPVERAPEVAEAGADQEGVVGAVGGLDIGLGHHLRDDRVEVGDRDPARAHRQALGGHVVAEGERAHPGEDRAPRGPGGHGLRHRVVEHERVPGQGIQVGRLGQRVRVVGRYVVRARGVGEEQDHVGRVLAVIGGGLEVIVAAGRGGKRSRAGGAGSEQSSPGEATSRGHAEGRRLADGSPGTALASV